MIRGSGEPYKLDSREGLGIYILYYLQGGGTIIVNTTNLIINYEFHLLSYGNSSSNCDAPLNPGSGGYIYIGVAH
jgi:hypothetical protein